MTIKASSQGAVSRRDVFRRAGGAGAAIFAAGGAKAQAAKVPQDAAGYQGSPHDGQVCQDCAHFAAPSSCQIVDGTITPQGWCKLYSQKS